MVTSDVSGNISGKFARLLPNEGSRAERTFEMYLAASVERRIRGLQIAILGSLEHPIQRRHRSRLSMRDIKDK
jgi:hypothetical protein